MRRRRACPDSRCCNQDTARCHPLSCAHGSPRSCRSPCTCSRRLASCSFPRMHLRQPASLSDSSARAAGSACTLSRGSAQECGDDAPRPLGPALGASYVAVVVTDASAHLESLLAARALIFIYWHGCVHPPLNRVLLLLPMFRSVQLESENSDFSFLRHHYQSNRSRRSGEPLRESPYHGLHYFPVMRAQGLSLYERFNRFFQYHHLT